LEQLSLFIEEAKRGMSADEIVQTEQEAKERLEQQHLG
jgi:hypothetical protein